MKKYLSILFFFAIPIIAFAQESFIINDYQVDIALNFNGSAKVTETIKLNFTEKRRGIIRSIPYRYTTESIYNQELARREQSGKYYITYLRDIEVKNCNFTTYYEGDFLNIKTGSEDKFLSGSQTYVISYTVWGAMNKFQDHIEFYWNIIGTNWDVPIKSASFNISFPGPLRLMKQNVLLYTGRQGEKGSNAVFSLSENGISGHTKSELSPNHGLSIVISFPEKFFQSLDIPLNIIAENFVIKHAHSKIKINKDASLNIEETYLVEFLKPCTSFTRYFNNLMGENDDTYSFFQNTVVDKVETHCKNSSNAEYFTDWTGNGMNKYISVKSKGTPFTNINEFTLRYRVYGAVLTDPNAAILQWNILPGAFSEPVSSYSFEITADPSLNISKSDYMFQENLSPVHFPTDFDADRHSLIPKSPIQLNRHADIFLKAKMNPALLDTSKIPNTIYARNYYIDKLDATITIKPNGVVHIEQRYRIIFHKQESHNSIFKNAVYYIYPKDLKNYTGMHFDVPRYSLFSKITENIVSNITFTPATLYQHKDWQKIKYNFEYLRTPGTEDSIFTLSYDIYNILNKHGKNYELYFPVSPILDEPATYACITILLPDNDQLTPISCEAFLEGQYSMPADVQFFITGNKLTAEFPKGINAHQALIVKLLFPLDYISKPNYYGKIRLLWINNYFLFIPLIFFILLFIIWRFIGRDKKRAIIVQYYPPPDISPAEAGYLWDSKLQNRDLISLIYFWAGKGLINIREIYNEAQKQNDFELSKLKSLPNDAKNFEKTIFNRLFRSSDTIKVSTLKNTFYLTMQQAEKEIKQHVKHKNFFIPGTIGFSRLLKFISYLIIAIGLITLMFTHYHIWQAIICFILMFLTLSIFSMIMPRRAHFGLVKYYQLKGFDEFISRASISELKNLLAENPEYFYQTISYAIVMGHGKIWADKFKPLITSPPSWYHTYRSQAFDTSVFTWSVIHSMYHINRDLNYKYASHSGGSSYSGRSYSSNSFSHSSWSGSGGSGFGGGHSGGGFGGGGGKSW